MTLTAKQETNPHLVADGGDLVALRHQSVWSNRDFTLTPVEESYVMVASTATCDTSTDRTSPYQDGISIANALAAHRQSLTAAAWHVGHKPLFNYCARAFAPYCMRYEAEDPFASWKIYDTIEVGSSAQLLKFRTHFLPLKSLESLSVKLRLWNPSVIFYGNSGASPLSGTYAYNYVWGDGGRLYYNFASSPSAPSVCEAGGFSVDVPPIANQGVFGQRVSDVGCYDGFNIHNGTTSGAVPIISFQPLWVYKVKNDQNVYESYYHDHTLSDAAKAAFIDACKAGDVYLNLGYHIGNMMSGGSGGILNPRSSINVYVSRVELILNCSWGTV